MSVKHSLTAQEREFFSLVNEAVLSNPFSLERVQLELKIAGLFPEASRIIRVHKTVQEVESRIQKLEKDDHININDFSGKDHELIKNALLFDFFYKFRKQFDALILKQIKQGGSPIKVSFAKQAFSMLSKRGFNPGYFFALCYQIRRAFFFIDRGLIGRSNAMKKLRLDLWNNVFTHNIDLYEKYLWNRMEDFSTLMLGETGTGKGAAAKAIGRSGYIPFDEKKECFVESFTRSFVSLNLSQFPESLLESELFGHKKGAFTGAIEDYKGAFDRCSPYGSILLDEIGEVSIPVQIKLLQILQDRLFIPVGSHRQSRFQGRVIAATNRPLEEIRHKKIFRDDFFYRLCSDIITIPSLRQRIQEDPEELNDLISLIIKRIVGQTSADLTVMVRDIVLKEVGIEYSWPGNVRELEQCVRRILLKGSYNPNNQHSIEVKESLKQAINKGNIDAQTLLSRYCEILYKKHKTFEKVSKITGLDRRTVKKYISIL